VLSEKIEAIVDMRDRGLLLREFQPSFSQELRDEGYNFLFQ